MPKKKPYKNQPEFYETLSPSMSYAGVPTAKLSTSSPLWIYPAWIMGSIVLGILFGLAIKDFEQPADIAVASGIVAKINDPQYDAATTGLVLSQAQSSTIQSAPMTSLQGNSSSLQDSQSSSKLQNGFSGYGQQGSVGLAAASR